MNTRCYRCGNSFALSREAVEAAVATATPDQKFHVEYCPRCRQANKIPMQQLRRTLPPGWTAPAIAPEAEPVAEAIAEPVAAPGPAAEATTTKAPRKRAAKTTTAAAADEPAPATQATPAAKKASRSKAKPS